MSPALPAKDKDVSKKGGVKVLVVSGSSGGHVFPALSFIAGLKRERPGLEALLILPRRSLALREEAFGCKVKYVAITPFNFRLNLKNILAVFNFFKGAGQSLFILAGFQPDVAVGFGSLTSIPVIIFAWLMRIPTLVHEQNVRPGRANRFLSAFADRVAISFPKTREYLQRHSQKIAYTGNPLREALVKTDRLKAREFFGFAEDKFTILVAGGSQASHRLNTVFSKCIAGVSRECKLQIIHLCGRTDYAFLKESYRQAEIEARLFEFLDQMQYAYSAADLVVCRSGATTVSEIMFFGLPAILIPYPYAKEHQFANARVLEENGCAVIIKDQDLNTDTLKERIVYFIRDADKLKSMRSAYRNFMIPDANKELFLQVTALAA